MGLEWKQRNKNLKRMTNMNLERMKRTEALSRTKRFEREKRK